MGSTEQSNHSRATMKSLLLVLLLGAVLFTAQASRVKRLRGQTKHELEKEESNKIYHGPAYKKARYYKKLRLGHRGEHRPANTRHDQDDLSLQVLTAHQDKPSISKHKKTNFNKVMKLKSLKPNKKMEKMYFKKEKEQKILTPTP